MTDIKKIARMGGKAIAAIPGQLSKISKIGLKKVPMSDRWKKRREKYGPTGRRQLVEKKGKTVNKTKRIKN